MPAASRKSKYSVDPATATTMVMPALPKTDDWERTYKSSLPWSGEGVDEHTRTMCPDMLAALLIEQEEELWEQEQ
jgi:hypothetical protein